MRREGTGSGRRGAMSELGRWWVGVMLALLVAAVVAVVAMWVLEVSGRPEPSHVPSYHPIEHPVGP